MGSFVVQQLTATTNPFVKWTVEPHSRFPGGQNQVANAVMDEQTWVAVTSKFEMTLTSLLDIDPVKFFLTQLIRVLAII